jgi:hypothetical protein
LRQSIREAMIRALGLAPDDHLRIKMVRLCQSTSMHSSDWMRCIRSEHVCSACLAEAPNNLRCRSRHNKIDKVIITGNNNYAILWHYNGPDPKAAGDGLALRTQANEAGDRSLDNGVFNCLAKATTSKTTEFA